MAGAFAPVGDATEFVHFAGSLAERGWRESASVLVRARIRARVRATVRARVRVRGHHDGRLHLLWA